MTLPTKTRQDVEADCRFRAFVGPFHGTLAADQTDTALTYGADAGGWIAPRAGSIVGISAQISAAVTGADQNVSVDVAVNGTPVAALSLDLTQAGGETEAYATANIGTHVFSAGDDITVEYDSDTITNTPTIVVTVEVAT